MDDPGLALVPLTRARWADAARVHEISATAAYRHIFSSPFPRAEAAERWRTYDGSGVLAVHEHATLGFAAWSGDLLDALYVLPQHAGRGIGSRLLAAVPPEVGRLWVLVENRAGRGFYERHGWSESSATRVAHEGVDEVLYRR